MTTKPISRSSGRSATASSAYRNACKITDERTGLTFDYSKKKGVIFSQAFDKDNNQLDRNELWNKAELAENRKDARTAREFIIAIPTELIPENKEDRENMLENMGIHSVLNFAKTLTDKYGIAVDIAIHEPDSEGDNRNYHAHIMTTTREVKKTDERIIFGDKSNIELSNKKLKQKGLLSTQEQIKELRKDWEDIANHYLEIVDSKEKIDCRSYKDQGKDQIPTVKLGWKASDMERRGIKTDRGDINRSIKADNERIEELKQQINYDIAIARADSTNPFGIAKPKPEPKKPDPEEVEEPRKTRILTGIEKADSTNPFPVSSMCERLQKLKEQNSYLLNETLITPQPAPESKQQEQEQVNDYKPSFRP